MKTLLMKGAPVAAAVREDLLPRIGRLQNRGITPGLAAVLVGDDPASRVYVRNKSRAFEKLGLVSTTIVLPADTSQEVLIEQIGSLNVDDRCHGILVQMPLPGHIHPEAVIEAVVPLKDVDGFHPENLGRLMAGNPRFIPCTPQGIVAILNYYQIPVEGSHAVVLGRSTIVGKPVAALLASKGPEGNATVTLCHTGTPDLTRHTRQADILIAAAGRAGMVDRKMVKAGVVIVDVGINRVPDGSEKGYHIEGDVDTEGMVGTAKAITPVPGGVGPMTIVMLLRNTVMAAELQVGLD